MPRVRSSFIVVLLASMALWVAFFLAAHAPSRFFRALLFAVITTYAIRFLIAIGVGVARGFRKRMER